jgi:hypothetical protein
MTAVMSGEGSPCEQPIDTLPHFKNRFRDSSAFQYIKGTARGDQVRTELEAVSK